jgi:hypothetical protein
MEENKAAPAAGRSKEDRVLIDFDVAFLWCLVRA